ncbi:MAG TPA: Tex-like N-terminal domain-containing protein, partial [Chroococcales cyanobacterium]
MIEEKNLEAAIARELSLNSGQVGKAIALLDEGNTIPFLARYRKEATGGLDEVQLRALQESLEKRRKLSERKEAVLKSVEEQGKLTEEIARKIKEADSLSVLEDLYLPFRPKRRTRAMIAREKGLTPLFELLLKPSNLAPSVAAQNFLGEGVLTGEDALAGARDILAEVAAEDPEVRGFARRSALQDGLLMSTKVPKAEDPQEKYSLYYGFSESVRTVQPHRVLAIDRGEEEGILRVSAELPEQAILSFMAIRWKA